MDPLSIEPPKPHFDSIQNLITGMGVGAYDPSIANQFFARPTLTQIQQSQLLKSGFLRKIVTKLPKAATTKWGQPTITDGDPEVINAIATALDKIKVVVPGELSVTGVKQAFFKALFNAFLTGNGAIVIHAIEKKGESLDLSQPIDLKSIKSVRKLVVFDRWQIQPVLGTAIDDEVSEFQIMGGGRVHASRVLWFDGEKLDYWGKMQNMGCDESILDGIVEVYKEYAGGIQGAARMLKDFDVLDIAIKGLWAMGKDQTETVRQRSQQNTQMQSIFRARIRDADNEIITHSTRSAGGYSELLTMLKDWMLANTEYPPAILFGEFSTGLNASGKTQEERALWNDTIADLQSSRLTHQLTGRHADAPGLLDILCACTEGPTKGNQPDGLGWQWNPLYTPTPTEQADLEMNRAQLATTIASMDPSFMPQYIQSAYGGNAFNPVITLTPEYKQQVADAAALVPPPQPEGEVDEYGNPIGTEYDEQGNPIAPEEASPEEPIEGEVQQDSADDPILSNVRRSVQRGIVEHERLRREGVIHQSRALDRSFIEFADGGELDSDELIKWRKFWREPLLNTDDRTNDAVKLLHGGRWGKIWCNR